MTEVTEHAHTHSSWSSCLGGHRFYLSQNSASLYSPYISRPIGGLYSTDTLLETSFLGFHDVLALPLFSFYASPHPWLLRSLYWACPLCVPSILMFCYTLLFFFIIFPSGSHSHLNTGGAQVYISRRVVLLHYHCQEGFIGAKCYRPPLNID